MSLFAALVSFWQTRRAGASGQSRAGFEARQARDLARWLARDLPKVAAYAQHRGKRVALQDLPVTDKARLMADFHSYNRAGITAAQVTAALQGDCRIGAYTVGASTGTSGNRGYFVITDAERYRWLGSLLAKALPDMLLARQRVAVILPQNTRLYESARRTGRIDLRFFDLTEGPQAWIDSLEAFAPTVMVAPPRLLAWLAARGTGFRPARVFSAAETLDEGDRAAIEAWSGQPLRQIYMATEGLLAVSCAHGRLHLAEDSVHFEFEPVGEGLVSPRITCFKREAQIMARYRMNDLLRLSQTPCPCGSPLQAVDEVVGRMDDLFRLSGPQGAQIVTPDALRNAVVRADARITDYRVIQTAPEEVVLRLPPDVPDGAADAARAALCDLLARRGLMARVVLERQDLPLDPARKLRRVECRLPRAAVG